MEQNRRTLVAGALIAFVVGFALSYVLFGIDRAGVDTNTPDITTGDTNTPDVNQTNSTQSGNNGESETISLNVPDQSAGASVTLSRIETPTPVWVAIHEGATPDATWVLGAKLVSAGVHENVEVSLLRETSADSRYFVKLHIDDGDRVFEIREDKVMINQDGGEIVASFLTEIETQ